MQVTADLVDWAWLSQLPDPSARVAALRDPPAGRVMHSTSLGCWYSDSAREMQEVGECLENLAEEVGGVAAEEIRTAFPLVASYRMTAPDELALGAGPDSYYYGSVSPPAVAAALEAACRLDLGRLAAACECVTPAHTERYLRQWVAAFGMARGRGWGVVARCR
jgi:hypothetical protein